MAVAVGDGFDDRGDDSDGGENAEKCEGDDDSHDVCKSFRDSIPLRLTVQHNLVLLRFL